MSDDLVPVSGRTGPIRVGVSPGVVPIVPGAESTVHIEVSNDDNIIRSVHLAILGLDPTWVVLPTEGIALFPGDSCIVDLRCRLPLEFPAGARRAAIEVRDSIGDLVPALVEFDLLVEPVEQLQLKVEPTNINAGRRGTFTTTVTNHGNSPVDVVVARRRSGGGHLDALRAGGDQHPAQRRRCRPWRAARQATVVRHPARAPAHRGRRRPAARCATDRPAGSRGRRPGATSTLVAVVQKPRLSRRLMTLLGLLLAATVFTVVLAATFANLAKQSDANAALLKESLGGNQTANGSSVAPTELSGAVTSSTGTGVGGVAIILYDKGRGPSVTIAQTVTDGNGTYRLANVTGGTYRIKFSAAGFTDVWYDGAT